MSGSVCCVDCFAHDWLREYVLAESTERGRCDYCGRENVGILEVGALYGPFKNLLHLYSRSEEPYGDALIDLIQWDHDIFDDDLHESGEADRLLEDIMDTGCDDDDAEPRVGARELYQRAWTDWLPTSVEWTKLCEEARANPSTELELSEIFDEDVGRTVAVVRVGTILYRARVGFGTDDRNRPQPFKGADIGAPPPDKAKIGRANAEGEVVLYVADQESTAVAEVRPSRGLLVSVVELRTTRDLKIVDLNNVRSEPFTDEGLANWELDELLRALGRELGRPLGHVDDPTDYIVCQKLVRRIRKSGFYDGIRYPSAMVQGGTNVVLFDSAVVEIGNSKLVQVTEIDVKYGPPENDW